MTLEIAENRTSLTRQPRTEMLRHRLARSLLEIEKIERETILGMMVKVYCEWLWKEFQISCSLLAHTPSPPTPPPALLPPTPIQNKK